MTTVPANEFSIAIPTGFKVNEVSREQAYQWVCDFAKGFLLLEKRMPTEAGIFSVAVPLGHSVYFMTK
ncbi:MAG: hypothetical protein IID12_02860 [Candidatus Marinimicrobia bacterium]|nr:hypothetical protein [Candidatus Neomarinimicrobiota bacterium]